MLPSHPTDNVYVNHLIARDWDVPKATKMILAALQWRMRRPCHRWSLQPPPDMSASSSQTTEQAPQFDASSGGVVRERQLREEAATGKIRVTGLDRHGRSVMVRKFDTTCVHKHTFENLASS
jgi:hypothetical protein